MKRAEQPAQRRSSDRPISSAARQGGRDRRTSNDNDRSHDYDKRTSDNEEASSDGKR
jgi:hypothetical protein